MDTVHSFKRKKGEINRTLKKLTIQYWNWYYIEKQIHSRIMMDRHAVSNSIHCGVFIGQADLSWEIISPIDERCKVHYI